MNKIIPVLLVLAKRMQSVPISFVLAAGNLLMDKLFSLVLSQFICFAPESH